MTQAWLDRLTTPLGDLTVVADDDGRLCAVGWFDDDGWLDRHFDAWTLTPRVDPGGLTSALRAYFGGDLSAIQGLPVAMRGTPFQRSVWSALREIPCGETWSYGQLAKRIGNPGAVRAVGLANGRNPVSVVVPCHRVIGADGTLTGYGGGLARKKWLLAHEGASFREAAAHASAR